jgi:CDP-glucose 4,6-dehydratase
MKESMKTFYNGKKILITGHTGFKGAWLSFWLTQLGADVCGIALAPSTSPSLYETLNLDSFIKSYIQDICDYNAIKAIIHDETPDIVFHLAAQPLVRLSYDIPIETIKTNILGTANVFDILRETLSVKVCINVTSDKCYLNSGNGVPFKESDSLGGSDIYSASKACSEILTEAYRSSFFSHSDSKLCLASARAGNVIGGGDWSKDRLIPDFIRAIQSKEVIQLRYPNAVRPWQHVLDPLSGYLLLAEKLWSSQTFSGAWNFGPDDDAFITVENVVKRLISVSGKGNYEVSNLPHLHEASLLTLDINKARSTLNWKPTWSVDTALEKTMEWYQSNDSDKNSIQELMKTQINDFILSYTQV